MMNYDLMIPKNYLRASALNIPDKSEPEIIRHFITLSKKNYCVDTNLYPLGSCTMKYNPKIHEEIAALPGFSQLHPYEPEELCQGTLKALYEFERLISEICGMYMFSLQPAAGAQGELAGMMLVHKYHKDRNDYKRRKVLIPDSSHGTNPASSALSGYEVAELKSNNEGLIDLGLLKKSMTDEVAAIMLTNPNTLGLFEKDILEISKIVHSKGGFIYCDGANLNALLGFVKPGEMGIDVLHINLHKTFSTPHGGGGPGSGPVGVCKALSPYLPIPRIEKKKGRFVLNYNLPHSIGRVKAFYGNAGVILRAYAYILSLGKKGLRDVSGDAVLNANYLRDRLKAHYELPYDERNMHEFVLSAGRQRKQGVSALDIAKRLLDYGFYAPTIYFPLIVDEAIMIEPTETESKETLDRFADAMLAISKEAEENPDILKNAPHNTGIRRLDDVKACREPDLGRKK